MLSTLSVLALVYGIIAFWIMFEESLAKKPLKAIMRGAIWLPLIIYSIVRIIIRAIRGPS